MKNYFIILLSFPIFLNASFVDKNHPFLLANFDNGKNISSINAPFGHFDFNPDEKEAYCRLKFIKDDDLHKKGYHLQIDYDVFSTQPAFNGVWFKLDGMDFSIFKELKIKIKGDCEKDFNDKFKIELKSGNEKVEYIITESC